MDAIFRSQCGYDLTGLAFPGQCPECGSHQVDPIQGIKEASTWFRSGNVWYWWAQPIRVIPLQIFHSLGDTQLRQVATRRLCLGMVLPTLLIPGVVLVASTIRIDYIVRDEFYDTNLQSRLPVHVSEHRASRRGFGICLDFHGILEAPPPKSWYQEQQKKVTCVAIDLQFAPDPLTMYWALGVPIVVLTGFVLPVGILWIFAWRVGVKTLRWSFMYSIITSSTLVACLASLAAWIALLLITAVAVREFVSPYAYEPIGFIWVLLPPVGVWISLSFGWILLLRWYRARVNLWWIGIPMTFVTVTGVVAPIASIVWILWC